VNSIITLTTDFGLSDPYVGIMKGVILGINPGACIVDICHQVEAGSVINGAAMLEEAYGFFPKGTIHVAVIDPGVGGVRRPIVARTRDYFFVGPDNGLFWPIFEKETDVTVIHLTREAYFLPHVSRTFHGRDIFTPVAAHLSLGADLLSMGRTIMDPVVLRMPVAHQEGDVLHGQIIRMDHFGNLITNISEQDLVRFAATGHVTVIVGQMIIKDIKGAYSESAKGEALALMGSSGYLEIAVNQGRAGDLLGADSRRPTGAPVSIRLKAED
jgi:S-adenosyl-L-methionine hydrolase (adenosine-forming)